MRLQLLYYLVKIIGNYYKKGSLKLFREVQSKHPLFSEKISILAYLLLKKNLFMKKTVL